eukprot:scaffold23430_cov57-Phaeocystis_antarctica.AAC.1
MCRMSLSLTSASPLSLSKLPMIEVATSESAFSGHGMNQSIVQPLIRPGKAWARDRNLGPTGEKHRAMCRLERTRSMKNAHRSSCVGSLPLNTPSYTGPISPMIASSSSRGKRLGSSPVLRKMLMYSRKPSLLISLSVMRKTTPLPCTPALTAVDVRAKPREALLARAAHADEQRGAAREREEARDAHHVLEGVVEQDEVHAEELERFIEPPHVPRGDGSHAGKVLRVLVDVRRLAQLARLLVQRRLPQEVDEVAFALRDGLGGGGGEVVVEHLLERIVEPALVLVVDEAVGEDALALMLPQRH